MRSDGELEAFYRFVNNDRVDFDDILAPHRRATHERALASEDVAVVHDTTTFAFDAETTEGLGHLTSKTRGFFGHFALAVDGHGATLGVADAMTWVRKTLRKRRRKLSGSQYARLPDRESSRWATVVDRVDRTFGRSAVHIMDREGDSYVLLAGMIAKEQRVVVRLRQQYGRRATTVPAGDARTLGEVVAGGRYVFERHVPLSRRRTNPALKTTHPAREARLATLHIDVTRGLLARPRYVDKALPNQIEVNVVRVYEVDAPVGEEPIEWWLATTEPIDTRAQVERVVDWYRLRWRIEEYFKALKTGCAFEKRKLESLEGLRRTLAILIPIAWHLLSLRDAARATPDAPATTIFSERQLNLLRAMSKRPLPASPTVEAALYVLAGQGGHLLRNGAPGWQTIGGGLEALWWAEFGYLIALNERRPRRGAEM